MSTYTLQADNRTMVGRKVKQLRKLGKVPATIYGKNVESTSIVITNDDFIRVYGEAGETGLIDLVVGSDKRPVLIHTVQVNPVTNSVLHVEFHQVNLKEKVKANVPLELVGEAQAVSQKEGTLLQLLDEIEVEALPAELPEKIEVEVSKLAHVNDELTVSDINLKSNVTVLTDKTVVVVRVTPLVSREAEQQAAEEASAAAEAAAENAPTETPTEAAATPDKTATPTETK